MDENSRSEVVVYPGAENDPITLDAAETRVLGALIEKQVTTPDYYPLTLNALVNACNQTSSRDPVVSYDETTVLRALDSLRDKRLAYVVSGADNRVPKYGHKFTERLELTADQRAVMCLLMLRGAQTPGELRSRSGRLHEFSSLTEVEQTLETLSQKQPRALVAKQPRQTGFKESRFAPLLSGDAPTPAAELPTASPSSTKVDADRIAALEVEVAALREELIALKIQIASRLR